MWFIISGIVSLITKIFFDCNFRLRQALLLVCLVEGGNPAPKVVWWRDGVVWDNEGDPSTYEDVLQNTLVKIESLTMLPTIRKLLLLHFIISGNKWTWQKLPWLSFRMQSYQQQRYRSPQVSQRFNLFETEMIFDNSFHFQGLSKFHHQKFLSLFILCVTFSSFLVDDNHPRHSEGSSMVTR